ncbi:MAG TPA: glutamyl-tRNA reductase [Candidatus Blautia faecigallinarum]|uniref:Glutamyl-tRNA reductase n=1 Tax=Candidatus Blautia faecigallinarum TaxID=2838488 RepID=A0A9D2DRP5_9FIRM|nr:glutamyl-tRNA reductase [Candidatus Blautia faecigallinarum]
MSISMIGVDHSRAPVDIRALFAFTKKNAGEAMERLKSQEGIRGCIILSTCNRLEIWASVEDTFELSLYDCLCRLKGIQDASYEEYFVKRTDREAVEHLFYLASGLKSQILGEDQILTQVKDALNLAREHFTTDSVLEVLFRMAVTAGKKIKTEVPFAHGNPSVIHQAVAYLESQGYSIKGKTCMVIGNGEMGKVAAQTLREAGGDVTVTVREYRSGIVQIPVGCKRINYTERVSYLPKCDLVVSATASPNFTLREEIFENLELEKTLILIDLAVPRDIEPGIGRMEGITLYDMDSFRLEKMPAELAENLEAAGEIVRAQMEEFYQWLDGRDVIPRIMEIKEEAVRDLNLRIEKILKNTPMEEQDRGNLLKAVDTAAGKVVNKLIFGLRDSLNQEAFLECVAGLEKIYEE